MTRRSAAPLGLLGLVLLLLAGCATARMERRLDPDSREFLSKVRYIISNDERRTFVALPPSERPKFIEEFWKKRDPDLNTEENEFKTEYFQRIDEANRLFSEGGGGEPGWIQDRGRIYILLGPPVERHAYPRGASFYGVPTEVWYYGFFDIVFVDQYWNGTYRLDPDSPYQLVAILNTQLAWKPQPQPEVGILDFTMEAAAQADGRALVQVKVPYKKIRMNAQAKTLRTTLSLDLEIADDSAQRIRDEHHDYPLEASEAQMEKMTEDSYTIEVVVQLPPGTYRLTVTLINDTDSCRVSKQGFVRV